MREVYTGMDPKEIESEYLNGVYNEIANMLGIEAAVKLYSTYRSANHVSGKSFHKRIYRIEDCCGI